MGKIEKLDEFVKQEKRYDFIDICDNESFFERDGNMRNYFVCVSCGFVPISMIDQETKYIDLHCRCGGFAVYSSFSEEEILAMLCEIIESMKNNNFLKDACSDVQ